ncbi:MAG TPA: ATP-grasp domain-containing protein [Ignavibacteriaceae bacterium]|nr:ATP-grasp domain-containing protein [Ignavibacteriaceae bacterium]
MSKNNKTRVAVVYNHVGDDIYEKIREVDPETLDFEPEYNIKVATITEEYEAIADALREEGYEVSLLNILENLDTLIELLKNDPPDVVFNLIEFYRGDTELEYLVAGLFILYGVRFTGATPFTLGLCLRKGMTKQLLLANNVPTPRYKLLSEPQLQRRHGLHYPIIIKPAREDASSGVDKNSVVFNLDQLNERIKKAFDEFYPPILVEEFIEGRELHVSVFGNDPPEVLPIIEFDFSGLPDGHPDLISYDAKWNPLEESFHRIHAVCPAKLTKRVEKKVRETALEAYKITGCRDYARLDMRLTKDNKVYVLEVNPNPDLTEGVSFMDSSEQYGLTFGETLAKIVEFALSRDLPSYPVEMQPSEESNPGIKIEKKEENFKEEKE